MSPFLAAECVSARPLFIDVAKKKKKRLSTKTGLLVHRMQSLPFHNPLEIGFFIFFGSNLGGGGGGVLTCT